uniref:Uncharacterized protein n=1 Tax=Populus alba TaxID=43335 RepID=A0A4U5PW53_POPAL|nr:hypothetical protein D5086_0000170780 [Populus alba]
MKQIREPGARGSYLKDSEKLEMYRLHKEIPEVYTVEKLAKDYSIMRQRVHAILWLKEIEEKEEKKLGHPLDVSTKLLLDNFPECYWLMMVRDYVRIFELWGDKAKDFAESNSSGLKYSVQAKVPATCVGKRGQLIGVRARSDVLWPLGMKLEMEVTLTREGAASFRGLEVQSGETGGKGRRGGGGWKYVSLPDGSSRPLDEIKKMYVRREIPRRRHKIVP